MAAVPESVDRGERAFLPSMSTRTAAYILFGLGAVLGFTNIALVALGGTMGAGPLISGGLLAAGVGLLAVEWLRDRGSG